MVIVMMTTMRMRWLGRGQQRQRGAQTADNNKLKVAADESALSPSQDNDSNNDGNNDGSGGGGGG